MKDQTIGKEVHTIHIEIVGFNGNQRTIGGIVLFFQVIRIIGMNRLIDEGVFTVPWLKDKEALP